MIQITGIPRVNPYKRQSPLADFIACPRCKQTYQPRIRLAICPHPIISPRHLFPACTQIAIRSSAKAKRGPLVLKEPYYFQQEGETAVRYQAFRSWIDAGEKRSFVAVARRLRKSDTIIRRWAGEDKWEVRLQAFNRDEDIERRAARKKLLQKDEADMFRLARGLGRITAKGLAKLVGDAEAGKIEEIGYDKLRAGAETTIKLLRLLHEQSTENISHKSVEIIRQEQFTNAVALIQEWTEIKRQAGATDEEIIQFQSRWVSISSKQFDFPSDELAAAVTGVIVHDSESAS